MLGLLNQKVWGPSNLCSQLILHMRKLWSERWSNLALVSRCDLWLLFETLFPSCHIFPPFGISRLHAVLNNICPSLMPSLLLFPFSLLLKSYFHLFLFSWSTWIFQFEKSVHLSLPMVFCFYFYFCISVWLYFIDMHSYQSFVSLYICSLRASMMFYLSL